MSKPTKKIFFVLAPVFVPWATRLIAELGRSFHVRACGIMGGPRRTFESVRSKHREIEPLIYSHDVELEWVSRPPDPDQLAFFENTLGTSGLKRLVIADRHIGSGFVTGAVLPTSKLLRLVREGETVHESYVVGMLAFMRRMLTEQQPDLIVSYAAAGAFTVGLFDMGKVLGIPCVRLAPTRIANRSVFDASPAGELTPVGEAFGRPSIDSKYTIQATEHLEAFRNRPTQPAYQGFQNRLFSDQGTLKHFLKCGARALYYGVDRRTETLHASYAVNALSEMRIQLVRSTLWRAGFFRRPGELPSRSFAYFPLHVDPEASTMVLSPYATNQLTVIEALAKSLPFGVSLAVKEHVRMLGRRPKGFYETLRNFPGVVLVSPLEDTFELTKRSRLVATITGTAALEAVFLRKPALVLGRFPYEFLNEGFVRCYDETDMTQAVAKTFSVTPAEDASLIRLLAAVFAVSFPFPGQDFWRGTGPLSHPTHVAAIEGMTRALAERLSPNAAVARDAERASDHS